MTNKTKQQKKRNFFDYQDCAQQGGSLFLWQRCLRGASFFSLLVLSLFLFSPVVTHAEEPSNVRMLSKSVNGQVGASTSQGFALITKADTQEEYEMWLPFQEAVQYLGGYSGKADLSSGDKVMVGYDEAQDGTKRILKSVNLIKKGEPPAETNSSSDDESSADQTF